MSWLNHSTYGKVVVGIDNIPLVEQGAGIKLVLQIRNFSTGLLAAHIRANETARQGIQIICVNPALDRKFLGVKGLLKGIEPLLLFVDTLT